MPEALPDVIVLDQPSLLYTLERTLWEALARLRPLHVVVDSSIAALADELEAQEAPADLEPERFVPSQRHIGALAVWLLLFWAAWADRHRIFRSADVSAGAG